MDQIGTPVPDTGPKRPLNLLNGLIDIRNRKSGAAEKRHQARLSAGDDHVRRGDPASHFTYDVGKAAAVRPIEIPVAQPLGVNGRQYADESLVGPRTADERSIR